MTNQPYKGLSTYEVGDQDIFCGREAETKSIISSLKLFRLTILHGAGGVGKSSILRAGVAATLRDQAKENLAKFKKPLIAVVVFPPLKGAYGRLGEQLSQQVEADIAEIDPNIQAPETDLPFVEKLEKWTEQIGKREDDGKLFIIFDQFEDFFSAYMKGEDEENLYVNQFARAVNYFGLRVNFLISIRSSEFTKLERFKSVIPNLMDRTIELKRLDRKSAEEAIRAPIRAYNKCHPQEPIEIEDDLVKEVLDTVKANKEDAIEAPYLQMVMKSLWEKGKKDGALKLRKQMLIDLGEAEGIVKEHFNKQMKEQEEQGDNRQIALSLFRYLVTPSGERIPQKREDLVDRYVEDEHISEDRREESKGLVRDLLTNLVESSSRILSAREGDRYEIYFDILAGVISNWSKSRRKILTLLQDSEKARQKFDSSQLQALKDSIKTGEILQEIVNADSQLQEDPDTIRVIRNLQFILENIREKSHFDHKNSPIYGASISPDGKRLATASFDGNVRIWNVEVCQQNPINQFEDPSKSVYNITFSQDGEQLATASWNGTVRLWNLQGQMLKCLDHCDILDKEISTNIIDKEISMVTFSPDGDYLGTASLDGNIYLWNLKKSPPQYKHILCKNPSTPFVHSLGFVDQGRHLAITFWDGNIYLWDVQENNLTKLGEANLLATASLTGMVTLWDLANPSKAKQKWQAHHAPISCVNYDAKSDEVDTVSWDGKVCRLMRKDNTWIEFSCNRNPIYRASFSPDRKKLVTVATSTGSAHLWDLSTDYLSRLGSDQLVVCKGHEGIVFCVSFNPTGGEQHLATASMDQTVRLWNFQGEQTGKFTFESPVYRVSFSPNGDYLGVALADASGKAYLLDLKNNQTTLYQNHKKTVYCLSFNSTSDQIASASEDGTVQLWDLQGKPLRNNPLSPESGTVYYVIFIDNDQKLAMGCLNGKILLQDLQSDEKVYCEGHTSAVYCLSFSPQKNLLSSASGDGTARLWNLEGKQEGIFRHESMVYWVSFSPDGERLATACADGKVHLWHVKSQQKIAEYKHHDGQVYSVGFSYHEPWIATASEDKTVKLRKIENLSELIKRGENWLGTD